MKYHPLTEKIFKRNLMIESTDEIVRQYLKEKAEVICFTWSDNSHDSRQTALKVLDLTEPEGLKEEKTLEKEIYLEENIKELQTFLDKISELSILNPSVLDCIDKDKFEAYKESLKEKTLEEKFMNVFEEDSNYFSASKLAKIAEEHFNEKST